MYDRANEDPWGPSSIGYDGSELRPGTYFIGVYGYCCDSAQYILHVELTEQCVQDCTYKQSIAELHISHIVVVQLIALCVSAATAFLLLAAGVVAGIYLWKKKKEEDPRHRDQYQQKLLRVSFGEEMAEVNPHEL